MEGRDTGSPNREQFDIVWVGRSAPDAYWDQCAGRFLVADFDNIYDAMARVLTDLQARILVLNALSVGTELTTIVKTVLSQGLFSGVFIYTTAYRTPQFVPNGDARVMMVESPQRLFDRLTLILKGQTPEPIMTAETRHAGESGEVEQKRQPVPSIETPIPVSWPHEAPALEKDHTRRADKPEESSPPPAITPQASKMMEPSSDEAGSPEINPVQPSAHEPEQPKCPPQKEFKAAQLTPEELQALLGPDFQPEKEE